MVTRRSSFTDIYLEADGLAKEISMVEDDGSISVADRQFEPIQWTNSTLDSPTIGQAVLDGTQISLQARNEAVLVSLSAEGKARPDRWAAYPDGRNVAYEISCFDYLNSIKMPGGRLGKRSNEVTSITEPFPSPSECSLVEREIHTVAEPVDLAPGFELESPDDESLSRLGLHPNRALAKATHPLPTELSSALLAKAKRPSLRHCATGWKSRKCGVGTAPPSIRTGPSTASRAAHWACRITTSVSAAMATSTRAAPRRCAARVIPGRARPAMSWSSKRCRTAPDAPLRSVAVASLPGIPCRTLPACCAEIIHAQTADVIPKSLRARCVTERCVATAGLRTHVLPARASMPCR